jgi:hypothetical protein
MEDSYSDNMIPLTSIRLKAKFHKLILFLDRAPQHCRSKRVKEYLEKNNDVMTLQYLPRGSSELTAVDFRYLQACKFLKLNHHIHSFLEKSIIERTIQYIKVEQKILMIIFHVKRRDVN